MSIVAAAGVVLLGAAGAVAAPVTFRELLARPRPVPTTVLSYGAHPHPGEMILYDRVDTRLLFSDFAARISLLGRG